MPVVVMFRAVENRLTIGFRRSPSPHQHDPDRDVLEQVTLIKDIQLDTPHRAHLDILFKLSLEECAKWMGDHNQPKNFDGLLSAWLARLDTEELNKQFYQKLFNWFEWAVAEAKFPTNEKRTPETRRTRHPLNHPSAVRLVHQRERVGRRRTVHRGAGCPTTQRPMTATVAMPIIAPYSRTYFSLP